MITLKELEGKIRIAVNILQSDPYFSKNHKTYLFKLLFFKRISDVFEEEAETTKNQTSDRKLAGNIKNKDYFLIPKGCGWNDLQHIKCNIGIKLSQALNNIESANPKLKGIFVNPDNSEWEKLDEKVLLDLVEFFSN
ncbi:MAG: type I restriction-modification system subunit M N-terminal domain-containing protein, partial [Cyanobacteria bacterium J06639_18]